MISLDQVLLLEQKVESAVAKIAQLNAENAALRSKCAELTNALSAKTEQFSSFQTDQGKIEEGILKALERLNTVENAVHAAAAASPKIEAPAAVNPVQQSQTAVQNAAPAAVAAPVQNTPAPQEPKTQNIPEPSFEQISTNTFDSAAPVQGQQQDSNQPQFDIF